MVLGHSQLRKAQGNQWSPKSVPGDHVSGGRSGQEMMGDWGRKRREEGDILERKDGRKGRAINRGTSIHRVRDNPMDGE